MIQDQEWVPASELLGVGGLPTSLAGLHKRARNEGWEKRSVTTPGVRGRAFAYRLQDLPEHVAAIVSGQLQTATKPSNKASKANELMKIMDSLSEQEKEILIHTLKRKGVEKLLEFCSQENQELISLTGIRRLAALSLNNLSEQKVREILAGNEAEADLIQLTNKAVSI
ncbi:TPA: DNA-binding protein [Shigella sonnei]|nr:DNA-binding protein [Shigella sonnei]EFX4495665.1 DNA-binding protein [Shigella sonnei]